VNPEDFWGRDYDHNPPLTDQDVERAEEQLGVKLPPEYVELLRYQNGGYTKGFIFPMEVETSWAEDHVALNELYGIGASAELSGLHNILNSEYMTREWELPPKQVLLAGDGHWWITLDYRENSEPGVTWLDMESQQDIRIADSFAAFLGGLQLEPEELETDDDEVGGIWRPESMVAEIRRDDEFLKIGQYLYLEQSATSEEEDEVSVKLEIPENWDVTSVKVEGECVVLTISPGKIYRLSRENHGALSFAILDRGDSPDTFLESIWNQHALC